MALLMLAKRMGGRGLLAGMVLALIAVLGGCGGQSSQASSTSAASASAIPSLTWQAPATREDGSSLAPNEIRGYRLYYKLVTESTYKAITLSDPSTTSLTLSGFSPGRYDFYVTAVDTNGLESPPSKIMAVTI